MMLIKRIIAFIVDVFAITMFIMIPHFMTIFIRSPLFNLGIFGLQLTLFLCKDCFDGQSVGKRLMKIQVVDRQTGNSVSSWRLIIRNIFIILWMIEGLVLIITNGRRLGDMLAKTKVIHQGNSKKIHLDFKLIVTILICYVVSVLIVFLILRSFPSGILLLYS